ncbi:MAG: hypothetical protein LC808_06655, partial [Actinobacteria bacterium]|nr:hypothetical protein [Actinomycetota bacterium]
LSSGYSWSGRGTEIRRRALRLSIAFAFRLIGLRNCASWRLTTVTCRVVVRVGRAGVSGSFAEFLHLVVLVVALSLET